MAEFSQFESTLLVRRTFTKCVTDPADAAWLGGMRTPPQLDKAAPLTKPRRRV
jgi:hypothetical protein